MLENREGRPVPEVTFHTRDDQGWRDVSTDEIFKGRTVIVFSLPGAYTPTCSTTHLPRFNELAPTFHQLGVDEIVCVSVNDAFVMNAWAADQEAEHIRVIPDGNGEFSEKMGMLVDKSAIGFGKRSWRYSMLVRDGVIEKQFVEPEEPGDPFKVSDADTMLKYLAPDREPPAAITVITKPGCPFCARAKALLDSKGMAFEEIVLGRDASLTSVRAMAGAETVPQVFINGRLIGGSDALAKALA